MDPVRLRKLRQTSQAAFEASSFSSWFVLSGALQVEPNCLFFTSQIQIFFYVLNSMRTCHQLAASLLYLDLNIF